MKYFINIALAVFLLLACNSNESNNSDSNNEAIIAEVKQIDSVTMVIESIQTDLEQSTEAVEAALSELDF